MRTHYDNLQVNSNASAEVIRASYRALIQKYHPDRFPDRAHGERVARIINEAFAVLGDPLARQAYDARLRAASAAPRPEAAKPPPAAQRQSSEAPSSRPSAAPSTPPSNWKSAAIMRVLRRMAWVRSYLAFLLIVVCAAGIDWMRRPAVPQSRPMASATTIDWSQFQPITEGEQHAPPLTPVAQVPTANANSFAALTPTKPPGGYITQYTNGMPRMLKPGTRVFKLMNYTDRHSGKEHKDVVYRLEIPQDGQPIGPTLVEHDFKTGIQNIAAKGSPIIPFRVVLPKTNSVYYLKLVSTVNKKRPLVTMLAHGGEVLNVKVPAGTYRLRYMSGSTWFGPTDKFGPGVSGSESDADLIFSRNGNDLDGNEIQLIERVGGNLKETRVLADDFE